MPRTDLYTQTLPLGPMLAVQLTSPQGRLIRRQGASALMVAVLEDAIDCFQKQFVRKNREAQQIGAEAEEWLFQSDYEWLFSFMNICTILDLDPHAVRCELLHWRQQQERLMTVPGHKPSEDSLPAKQG